MMVGTSEGRFYILGILVFGMMGTICDNVAVFAFLVNAENFCFYLRSECLQEIHKEGDGPDTAE